jgi:hypothetical protein
MSSPDIDAAVNAYAAGLEAEVSILRQLESLAAQEHQATVADDLDLVTRISDERVRLMSSLLIVENQVKPLRPYIEANRADAESAAGFDGMTALHGTASRMVRAILGADEETLRLLHEAAAARRSALQAIEQGGQTLTAYRRVISPTAHAPSLFDGRG